MAFLDFIPDNASDRERGVFFSASHQGRSKDILTFRIFIGNKILEQLRDNRGVSWTDDSVMKVMIRVGTGEDSGQMIIGASEAGNIILKTKDVKNPQGRFISVRNMPGVKPMKSQSVKWCIEDGPMGKILHILEYMTDEVTEAALRNSEAGGIGTKAVASKQTTLAANEPIAAPYTPKERAEQAGNSAVHKRPTKEEAYAAMGNIGKKK